MTTSGKKEQEFYVESSKNSVVVVNQEIQSNNSNRLPMVIDQTASEAEVVISEDSPKEDDCKTPPTFEEIYPNNDRNFSKTKTSDELNSGTKKKASESNKLEEGDNEHHYDDKRYGWHRKTRFHVALLGLAIAVVNCYAQATFCIAIVEMVIPSDFVFKGQSSQSVAKIVHSSNSSSSKDTLSLVESFHTGSGSIADNSCPIEYQYRDYYDSWRFPSNINTNSTSTSPSSLNQSSNIIDISNRFDWDASRQGLLLGAFAIGTAPLQVLGGRLAEIYGAKWVLFVGCIGTALTNLSIPFLAHFSFALLIINRVVMGIAQAGMEPGLMCLLAEWMTPAETGFFISMLLFAICIGFFLGSLCSSFLLTLGYGWPITYYVAGGINLLVAIIWMCYASSRPKDSQLITADELKFIEHEQGAAREQLNISSQESNVSQDNDGNIKTEVAKIYDILHTQNTDNNTSQGKNLSNLLNVNETPKSIGTSSASKEGTDTGQAPWLNILSTRSVWAFIICKISIRWCADVLSIELPTYLANVLHLSIKLNGIVNSVSSALFAIFSFLTGYLVNKILQNQQQSTVLTNFGVGNAVMMIDEELSLTKGISKTNLRKLMQSFASFGAAISLFLMTHYDCNILFSMSMLLILSCCLVMGTGGELQIPYDMTSKYPGTLHGMACTLSVSGWLAPPLIGLILGDQPSSRYRWSIVWYMTALINLIGGLVFVLFADASPRDFDREARELSTTKRQIGQKLIARGHHRTITSGSKTGYYNVACKSADNSPPSETHQLHGGQETCKFASVNRLEWQQSKQHDSGWLSHFDSQPIKVRQVEESFIRPYYLNSIDSVAASAVIFPYRTKQLELEVQQQADQEKNLNRQQQQGAEWNQFGRQSQTGGSHYEPTNKGNSIRSLWPRIRRRRRKFCVKTSNDREGKLIGSTVCGKGSRPAEPEGRNQMASVEIMIPADVLPHCRKQQRDHRVGEEAHQEEQQQKQQLESQLDLSSAAVSMTTKTITHL